ncbi:MAG: hypothetical protein ACOZF0_16975 [Thermodesulfobacteriota bacterium]
MELIENSQLLYKTAVEKIKPKLTVGMQGKRVPFVIREYRHAPAGMLAFQAPTHAAGEEVLPGRRNRNQLNT